MQTHDLATKVNDLEKTVANLRADNKRLASSVHSSANLIQRLYCVMVDNQNELDGPVLQEVYRQIDNFIKEGK
jgi:hypothetical protein